MNKQKEPQIAVIGLGAFGMELVKTLAREGAHVIAVDNNMDHLDEVRDLTKHTICFDATDPVQLKSHGITDVDIAVIAIGEKFEPVVLIAMELINTGVKVYGRANSKTQEQILKYIGVAEIIHPERQVAERMGVTLHRSGMVDLLDLGEDLSIFEIQVPKKMVGYSLAELQLRKRYGINVLTIKRIDPDSNSQTYISRGLPSPNTKLKDGDKMIVFGDKKECEKMMNVN